MSKGKKANKPQAATTATKDPVDSLDEELSEVLRKDALAEAEAGPLFDEAPKAPPAPVRKDPPKKAEAPKGDLVGKRVKFFAQGEDGGREVLVGKVVIQDLETGDLEIAVGEGDDEAVWTAKPADVTALDAEGNAVGDDIEADPEVAAPQTSAPRPVVQETQDVAPFEVRFVEISKVKIAKIRPRLVNKESEKYKSILADVQRRIDEGLPPLRQPIDVTEDLTLIEGGTRLAILSDLGRKLVPARVIKGEFDDAQRLAEGLRANLHRQEMHWMDVVVGIQCLIDSRQYLQKDLAREFGFNPSDISRMKGVAGLSEPIKRKAREGVLDQTSVLELTSAPPEVTKRVQEEILERIGRDEPVGKAEVRRISSEAREKHDAAVKAQDPSAPSIAERRAGPAPRAHASYRDLSVKDVGDLLAIRVRGDRIEATFTLMHAGKSFEGFDLVAAIKDALDATFGNDSLAVRSLEDLNAALDAAKAEVAS